MTTMLPFKSFNGNEHDDEHARANACLLNTMVTFKGCIHVSNVATWTPMVTFKGCNDMHGQSMLVWGHLVVVRLLAAHISLVVMQRLLAAHISLCTTRVG